jgi:predicted transcriptional regulator
MQLRDEIHKFLTHGKMRPYQLADLAKVPRTCVYRLLKGERGVLEETAQKLRRTMAEYKEAA